jgi:LmbE family N-acetylglucosaminyl deacetylase
MADDAVLLFSPHFDDGVLSCAYTLAAHPDSSVVTVFGGAPPPGPLTPWDADCGFSDGDDVVGARRNEDAAALAALGAQQVVWEFLDYQYGRNERDAIAARLDTLFSRASVVYLPLGIGHPDHITVRSIGLEVSRDHPDTTFFVFADLPYFGWDLVAPAVADARSAVADAGFDLRVFETRADDLETKQAAVGHYATQVPALQKFGFVLPDHYAVETTWALRAR